MRKFIIKLLKLENYFWRSKLKEDEKNRLYYESSLEVKKNHIFFDVPGAGKISISNIPAYSTGGSHGFGIDISWGRFGYTGGVIGINEAQRLAVFILDKIKDIKATEEMVVSRQLQEYAELKEKYPGLI